MQCPSTQSRMLGLLLRGADPCACLVALSASVAMASCMGVKEPDEAAQGSETAPVEAVGQSILSEIVTYAGTGDPRFRGDGGPATEAGMYSPQGLSLDKSGNLFIAADKRIRKVDAVTGVITTVAGSGRGASSGDGGPALEAGFGEVYGIDLDGEGNLFFADNTNGRVRKVEAATGIVVTVAGGGVVDWKSNEVGDGGQGSESFVYEPLDVTVGPAGNIYITADNRLRRVDLNGVITTVSGNGRRGFSGDGSLAFAAQLAEPESVVVDAQGTIYIADSDNHRVRRIDVTNGIISTVAGVGHSVTRVSTQSTAYSGQHIDFQREGVGGGYSGDGGPAIEAKLTLPSGLALGPMGNLFFVDGSLRVRRIDSTGIITTVAAGETVTSYASGKVLVKTGQIGELASLAVGTSGEMFLTDKKNNVVHKVSP